MNLLNPPRPQVFVGHYRNGENMTREEARRMYRVGTNGVRVPPPVTQHEMAGLCMVAGRQNIVGGILPFALPSSEICLGIGAAVGALGMYFLKGRR